MTHLFREQREQFEDQNEVIRQFLAGREDGEIEDDDWLDLRFDAMPALRPTAQWGR